MRRFLPRLSLLAAAAGLTLLAACNFDKGAFSFKTKMDTAQNIQRLEREIATRQDQMDALMKQYLREGGTDLGSLVGRGLTVEQTRLVESKLKNEESVGYRDLLSDILNKQKEIESLNGRVQELELTLPAPVEVARGQRHYDLAMDYLTHDRGLSSDEAKNLVRQVNLLDELEPGFKVWNFYDRGVFGTFVTQGSASVSPYGVQQAAKQKLIHDREVATAQRDALSKEKAALTAEVADLTAQKGKLTEDVTLLTAEREVLTRRVGELQALSEDLTSKNNSLYYRVGYRKALVSEGAVRDTWYGRPMLAKYDEASYPQRVDLRGTTKIEFTAQDAGVARIRKVSLAPSSVFRPGQDYAVAISPDGTHCSVTLLAPEKFRAVRSTMVLVN